MNTTNKIIEENRDWINSTWEKLDNKLKVVSERSKNKIPYTTENGVHNDMAKKDIAWWTNGFWGGLMWLMYVGTKDEHYRAVAENAEEILDKAFEDYDNLHHDVGFMWHISSGVNYRLFGGKKSRLRTIYAANMLASRYNAEGKFIRSWNKDHTGWVIVDSLMNIPLLYWASDEHNDPRYKYIALNHADTVLKTHIRADGSANHIVNLNPRNGEVIETFGGQGYGVGSSWSRGQSWAVYGFILNYIHTGRQEYLDAAKRTAHYFISCIADTGYVSLVDFRAPDEPVLIDTTASACAACGLIEIANNVGEYEKKTYLGAAMKILKALEEKYCDWSDEEDSVLQMGTEAYLSPDSGRHIPIIYGDYFFAEAIYKLRGNEFLFW